MGSKEWRIVKVAGRIKRRRKTKQEVHENGESVKDNSC